MMRIAYLLFCASLVSLSGVSTAGETLPEPQAMIYYQIPFGASGRASRHIFGVRVDQTFARNNQTVEFQSLMARPALLDFRAGYDGIQALSIGGMDYAQRYRALRQNEEGGDAPEGAEGSADETAEAPSEESAEEEYTYVDPGPTIGELLDEAEPGWLIGGVLGIVLLTGVLSK